MTVLAPGNKLGPYEIVAPLGAGGMGEVYRAKDTRLGRDVAIKVLPEKLADNPEALARFEREAKAIAALSHPNILSIFDVGNEEGVSFVVTELLEGETLRQQMRGSAVPWRKAIDYGSAIADGLAAAHAKGVIHRDLKPENIFLTSDGGVKILDFGLARIEPGVGGDAGSGDMVTKTLDTKPGTVLGTLNYMSPEQVRGKKTDARSDIFALGCVLHEMVGGQKTFSGETSADTMTAILKDEPVSVLDSCSDAGPELDRVISRCLEKKAEQRFHSATDLAFTLRGILSSTSVFKPPAEVERGQIPTMVKLLGALALSAGLIFAGWYVPQWLNKPATAPPVDVGKIRSLAVLPVDNISGDPAEEFFADSMTDALITDLSKISALKVISRPSVMPYKNTGKPLKSIARELKVDALLSSSVVRVADKVRITAQLIDGATEDILWSDKFDGDMTDILALQADVARSIAAEVKVTLTPDEESLLADAPPVNAKAHDAYMRGLHSLQKTTEAGGRTAIAFFEKAIAEDPDFALAYAGLAKAYMALTTTHLAPKETMPFAKDAATRALLLDGNSAEAHTVLGKVKFVYDWDWPGAEAEFKQALEINPNLAEAHLGYASYLAAMLRPDESIAHLRTAEKLDPVSIVQSETYGLALFNSRRYDQTIEFCRRAIRTDPDYWSPHVWLGLALSMDGRYEEAIEELKQARRLNDVPVVAASLGDIYARSGDAQSARDIIDHLVEEGKTRYVCPYEVGVIYVGLEEPDNAFDRLDQACEDQSDCIPWLQADPRLDPIRSDPRFDAVLRRAGFTPPEHDDTGAAAPRLGKTVLVVLPFEGLSTDTDTNYLKEEIPASIIQSLSRLSDLRVIPRSTAFRYEVGSKDTATIGRDLGATAVLTGQINARGDGLSIRAELVDVASNRQLWDERYNRKSADIIEVEQDIARNISDALRLRLTSAEQRSLKERHPENAQAYLAYLHGRFWWRQHNAAANRKALRHFEGAIAADPDFALAYAGVADVCATSYGIPLADARAKADAAIRKALELDDTLAEAYTARGLVNMLLKWDWQVAERDHQRALALDPKIGWAHHVYGHLLMVLDRDEEALSHLERALQLEPRTVDNLVCLGGQLLMMGRYDEAERELKKAVEWGTTFGSGLGTEYLGWSYLLRGRNDEAIDVFENRVAESNRNWFAVSLLAGAEAVRGNRTRAHELLDELLDESQTELVQDEFLAPIYAALGDYDEALRLLERAHEARIRAWLPVNLFRPGFNALRSDPRFKALLRRMNITPPEPILGTTLPQAARTTLAVLPFDDRSGDPDARYLADEIPASIIDSLSMLSQLQVVPRSTAFRHRDRIDDVATVGKLLNAYAVLTGQINTHGKELRIRAELIEVATGRQLWSQRYDQSLADTLAVETEITARIAEALQVQFGVTERARLRQRCPVNSEAHCKYLEGRFWWNKRSLASVRKSIELFDEALSLDPQYALAHVGMADSYCVLGWAYDRSNDTFPKARAAAEKALAIDPDLAEAYPAIGFVRLVYDWDAAGAKKAFDHAIALDPVYAKAHHWYTMYLLLTGRPDEGLASARQAQKRDPGSLMINWRVGTALAVGRDYAAAAKQLQHTLEMEPNFLPALQMLGTVYQRMERYDEAIEICRRLYDHDGRAAISAGSLGLSYALAGRRAEALEELRILEELAEERYIPPLAFAEIHAGLGDKDEAFTWLDRAINERDCHVVFLRSSPTFDELRADPRFDDLLQRIGSEP